MSQFLKKDFTITNRLYIYTIMLNKNTKQNRLELLKQIISEKKISDQGQLLNELKKKGIDTTQATISRDFQKLKTVKVRVRPGVYKYKLQEKSDMTGLDERLAILFENFVYDMKSTGNQLIIKTTPGNANSVASLIDHRNTPEILGTIAGDDTILVITESEAKRIDIEKNFKQILDRVS